MTHNTNFNKISFIDWSKLMFIIIKHVFYNLSYAITMSNTIKEMTRNIFNNQQKWLKNNYNGTWSIILLTKFNLNNLV
jgi:hypothetical protein